MALPTRVQRGADPMDYAQREFDGLLGRLFGQRFIGAGDYSAPYAVDVREDSDHIYVDADLPGFRKDEVDINLENQTLTISAEHRENRDNKDEKKAGNGGHGEWLLHERRYTRFARSFTLPPTVDASTVSAKLNDGVLTVTINKREETKPRRITVS